MKRARQILLGLGILIALFGAGIDYLLPGASPGLNLPQILIIAVGLALALGASQLRRMNDRARRSSDRGKTVLKVLIITLLTIIILELLLAAWGRPTYFPRQIPSINAREIPWGICDELGCRKKYEAVVDACASGYLTGIRCVINRDGFGDSDEFVLGADFAGRKRILMLGDSYTRGFFADVGKSFVDSIEDAIPDAIVWNVSEPGTATNQAVLSFNGIAPRLKPQLSILGFYMNDFPENLLLKEMSLRLIDDEGKQYFVRRFEYDRWGNPVNLPEHIVNAYLAAGARPPASELERVLGITHLGTLALRTLDFLLGLNEDESFERQTRETRKYLAQLRDAAAAMDSQLLILLIPQSNDVDSPDRSYRTAVRIFEELRIAYVEVRHLLDSTNDYVDFHWNNSGHQKVGAYLSECVTAFFAERNLADCERAIIP